MNEKKKIYVTPTPHFQSHINSIQYKIKFENLITSRQGYKTNNETELNTSCCQRTIQRFR